MKVFIILSILVASVFAYKDSLYCPMSKKHVACKHPGTYLKSCSNLSAKLAKFTDDDKKILLDAHNELRNQVAGGNLAGFPSATKMKFMVSFFTSFIISHK